jgi:hypothetical protein
MAGLPAIPNPNGFTASVGNTLSNVANALVPANCTVSIGVSTGAGALGGLITGGPLGAGVWGAVGYAGSRASCDTSGNPDSAGWASDPGQADIADSSFGSW